MRDDGTIETWGSFDGITPEPLDPNSGFTSLSSNHRHLAGLREDGSIAVIGDSQYGVQNVPEPNSDFVDVSVGYHHVVGLKADGSIVAWGYDYSGQLDVPAADPTFVKVAAGGGLGFAIREDGTIVPWGVDDPSVFDNYTDVADIDATGQFVVTFRHFDGSLTVWSGKIPMPMFLSPTWASSRWMPHHSGWRPSVART